MNQLRVVILVACTLISSWLGMQAVHELGHVLAAWMTGGEVTRVALHPLSISRTDVAHNAWPRTVVWAGPIVGALLPLAVWSAFARLRWPGRYVLRFFAGFCLIANGLYIGLGSFQNVGDCGTMLQNGAKMWQLWFFGIVTVPAGFLLWNGQGKHFGIGPDAEPIAGANAVANVLVCLALIVFGLWIGR